MFRGGIKQISTIAPEKSHYSRIRDEGEKIFLRLVDGSNKKKDSRLN